jgi:hypothetical protein
MVKICVCRLASKTPADVKVADPGTGVTGAENRTNATIVNALPSIRTP